MRVLNDELLRFAGVTEAEVALVEERERAELERRARRFRGGRARVPLAGRTVIVVDDGVATGSTARAACLVAREQGAARVVLAVPVAPPGWGAGLGDAADELVCLETPEPFFAVGQWYADFSQTSDEEVADCLAGAPTGRAGAGGVPAGDPPGRDEDVTVRAGPVALEGHLTVPDRARGLVVFAHGSGSSRHSPRNRFVATVLHDAGLATLLFDLLVPEEEAHRANVFDIGLLAERLAAVTRWLHSQPDVQGLRVGYFGASTGAAAALWAATEPDTQVAAVVCRGGRPDLAGARLADVVAPTLLIVGGRDDLVLKLNTEAAARLWCPHRLSVVPGATHLFEEPGTLARVADLARDWFLDHLAPRGVGEGRA